MLIKYGKMENYLSIAHTALFSHFKIVLLSATTHAKLWDTGMECVIPMTTVNVEVETAVGVTSSKMYDFR